MDRKFAVIIVTYNRIELLKECLECVRNQEHQPNIVIIVDNHSTDGTDMFLSAMKEIKDKKWILKREKQNIGGSGGFHDGLKLAAETDSDWFLLIDDDAMIAPNYLQLITESISKHPQILAYSGTVITDGEIVIDHRRRFNKNEIPVEEEEYKKDEFQYDLSSFCGVVVNRKIVDVVGYPERDFFIWYDDTEYSLRIMSVSKFVNVNLAILNHKTKIVNPSLGKATYKLSWKYYYGYRNIVYTCKKHGMVYFGLRYNILRWTKLAIKNRLDPNIDREVSQYNMKLVITAIRDGISGKLGINELYKP